MAATTTTAWTAARTLDALKRHVVVVTPQVLGHPVEFSRGARLALHVKLARPHGVQILDQREVQVPAIRLRIRGVKNITDKPGYVSASWKVTRVPGACS